MPNLSFSASLYLLFDVKLTGTKIVSFYMIKGLYVSKVHMFDKIKIKSFIFPSVLIPRTDIEIFPL